MTPSKRRRRGGRVLTCPLTKRRRLRGATPFDCSSCPWSSECCQAVGVLFVIRDMRLESDGNRSQRIESKESLGFFCLTPATQHGPDRSRPCVFSILPNAVFPHPNALLLKCASFVSRVSMTQRRFRDLCHVHAQPPLLFHAQVPSDPKDTRGDPNNRE